MAAKKEYRVTTGKILVNFPELFETTLGLGTTPHWSVQVIVSKKDKATLALIEAKIKELEDDIIKSKYAGKKPKKWLSPLRDGDEEKESEEYENAYFLNAKAYKYKPKVVNKDFSEILDPEEIYSGCFGRAVLTFYHYDNSGSVGIACGISTLMKVGDGEPLSGGRDVRSDFEDMDDEDLD